MERQRALIVPHRPSSEAGYRPPVAQLEHRINLQRRRFAQGLGRRPTADELAAMRRAACLTVIADHALSDPACDANTQVRLTNAATRARAAMLATLNANRVEEPLATYTEIMRLAEQS
jgi:hypothetical protein